jgi:predicted RNase H-like HicB family nuclease
MSTLEIEMTDPKKPPRSARSQDLRFKIETERETDGRWIAEISDTPGVLAYGKTKAEAKAKAYALALRVIADDVEKSKKVPASISVTCQSA